jgi:hypothetical protein
MRRIIIWGVAMLIAGPAFAAPGVGDPVYGATIEKGVTEFEARYGRLTGGVADGEDGLILEIEHGFSNRLAGAVLLETGRDPGGKRLTNSASVEAIYALGNVKALNLDVALYGEYKFGFRSNADVVETKLLLQHRAGGFDSRLNLIAEKPLAPNEPVELAYAASVDWQVAGDEVKLGLTAFGDFGTTRKFGGRQEHFIGPTAKFEIEHLGPGELEIETGWLRAFGSARDETDGQARLLIDYELHF